MNIKKYLICVLAIICLSACENIDSRGLSGFRVDINLRMKSVWDTYGCPGLGTWQYFNYLKKLPSNFPYTATSYTGLGGVILFYTSSGLVAFEAACPVERKADIYVHINSEGNLDAVCPKCGSHYDVFNGTGSPLSGEAISRKVGLTRYNVYQDNLLGGYQIASY